MNVFHKEKCHKEGEETKMKYFKKFVGENVYLSPMSMEDASIYTNWMNTLTITEGLGSASLSVSLESEREWIKKNAGTSLFAIVSVKTDELLGNCGIENINSIHQFAEVGLFIGEENNRNQGYGAEALGLLLDYGFDYLNLNNIMLKVFSFNERAIQCYKKVGFKEIGRRREVYYLKGKFYDNIFMDILRREWRGNAGCLE